ncbi:MAG: hypothetical protein KL863_07195 [Rhizobium sp.]|nr:hypothetical protein [Rhizobium sp.]
MRMLKTLFAVATLLLAAGCTIESDIIMPDPTASGDAMLGFPSDRPFRLETLDSETGAYKPFATLTPERQAGAIRYAVTLDDGTPNRLMVQARRMGENDYMIRFSQMIGDLRPSLNESGLAFVTISDGSYYMMSSISDDGWLEEIFKGEPLPRGGRHDQSPARHDGAGGEDFRMVRRQPQAGSQNGATMSGFASRNEFVAGVWKPWRMHKTATLL